MYLVAYASVTKESNHVLSPYLRARGRRGSCGCKDRSPDRRRRGSRPVICTCNFFWLCDYACRFDLHSDCSFRFKHLYHIQVLCISWTIILSHHGDFMNKYDSSSVDNWSPQFTQHPCHYVRFLLPCFPIL